MKICNMNFCFLLNINYHFVQSSCFCKGFIISFIETYPSFKHFKIDEFKDPLKQHAALAFCRDQIKDLSSLTETHINHDEMHYIRSNWLSFIPSFSPMEKSYKRIVSPASSGSWKCHWDWNWSKTEVYVLYGYSL